MGAWLREMGGHRERLVGKLNGNCGLAGGGERWARGGIGEVLGMEGEEFLGDEGG